MGLLQTQHALYKRQVGLVHQGAAPQGTFALLGLLGQQMALKSLGEGDIAAPRYLERFLRSRMCFNLWHCTRVLR